jgi:hypothetical protein
MLTARAAGKRGAKKRLGGLEQKTLLCIVIAKASSVHTLNMQLFSE